MRTQLLVVALAAAGAFQFTPAGGAEAADFIDGSYTKTIFGCELAALLRGSTIETPKTVPDMLDAKGFKGWGRRCEFTKITVDKPDKVWTASMQCVEGEKCVPKIFTFSRDSVKDTYEVSSPDQDGTTTYFSCKVD